MTLLLFLKPIFHQGGVDHEHDHDGAKKRKKKVTKKFVKKTAQTLELEIVDVKSYIEDILKRESEIAETKQEQERQERVIALMKQVGDMVKKSYEAKRKRLNKLITYILD